MKRKSTEFLDELIAQTIEIQNFAISLLDMEGEKLLKRPSEKSWNVLECVEHLNRYGGFYIPKIKDKIAENQSVAIENFKSGWLGNYFAKSMLSESKKMNTFKAMNPLHFAVNKSVINTFIVQQEELLQLLNTAKTRNINKIKISTMISQFIKINLGDAFRFVIYHNQRHIEQIKEILEARSISGRRYPNHF